MGARRAMVWGGIVLIGTLGMQPAGGIIDPNYDWEIYVAKVDDSGVTQITDSPGGLDNVTPTWSSDGSQIAFSSDRDGGDSEVYVLSWVDGSQGRRTNQDGADDSPSFAPDGRMAFATNRDGNGEIYVLGPDGSLQNLTNDPATDSLPTWSPDGTRIAFVRTFGSDPEIFVMNADGSGQTNLSANNGGGQGTLAIDTMPAWSPDGGHIAFISVRTGGADLFVMGSDGAEPTNLTKGPDRESNPNYAPDGRIGFVSDHPSKPGSYLYDYGIYVMNPDGSGVAPLFVDPSLDPSVFDWAPDGSYIVFQARKN
jgi:Tol biopolymer transport system component